MDSGTKIAVVGTGAVGGYYGALLQRAGFQLHFLLHHDVEHVRSHGLSIESRDGNFVLPCVNAYGEARMMPRCDLAIVALKTTANHLLPSILPHILKPGGVVLTLQNGLGSEQTVGATIGHDRVVGGLCFLCANKTGPGAIRHLDYGLVTLGDYRADGRPAGITPRLRSIGGILQEAGIPTRLVEDLPLARWKKLLWNIPFNGLSVAHDALTDVLVADPTLRALCRELMEETAAAAAACARPIESAFLEKMMSDTERMKPYATSMKLDYDRGLPMEIDSIYGAPLLAAKAAGVAMPETEKLYRTLQVMEAGRLGGLPETPPSA